MNKQTKEFLRELKGRAEVLGVILFGSWARGNNRSDSDVDLVVILKRGLRRTVERRDGQAFEIIYTTPKGAYDFWKSHKDDAAGLWDVAKILYDRNGTIRKLKLKTEKTLAAGKKPIDSFQLGQFRFDAEDQIKYAEATFKTDPITASLILANKIFALTELFFDIRQKWTPAPKQRLAAIKKISPRFSLLLKKLYQDKVSFQEKIKVAKKIVPVVFGTD